VGAVTWFRTVLTAIVIILVCGASSVLAQEQTPDLRVERAETEDHAVLRFANRPVVTFRATLVPRRPEGRVAAALRELERLSVQGRTGPVGVRPLGAARVISVAGHDVLLLVPDDLDEDSAQTIDDVASEAVAQLEAALAEAAEARTLGRLAWSFGRVALATLILLVSARLLRRTRRATLKRLVASAEAGLARTAVGSDSKLAQSFRLPDLVRGLVNAVALVVALTVTYGWLTYTLDQFPYTRPWGETLGDFLVGTLSMLGRQLIGAIPGLFTVAVIIGAARFTTNVVRVLFDAAREGRIDLAGLTGIKATATQRLLTALLWLLALVVAYPYFPGSSSDAFKGLTVFLGLVISLGATGIVNQLISGLMIVYSDALAPGEYVQIGAVEGVVVRLGVLAITVRTPKQEDVTIPNAVVVSGTTVNYSRNSDAGVFADTTVTIGYDTPWRQVEGLLLEAASRTDGIRTTPTPRVMQTALSDFYVEYSLRVCLQDPAQRRAVLSALHAAIQDQFNAHGVQIMSPHYLGDPATAKIVPRDAWNAPPSRRPAD